jgi:hypothetical protein
MNMKAIISQLANFRGKHKNQKYAFTFTKEALDELAGRDGVRIYLGQDGDEFTAYIVGVRKNGDKYDSVMMDISRKSSGGLPCPDFC